MKLCDLIKTGWPKKKLRIIGDSQGAFRTKGSIDLTGRINLTSREKMELESREDYGFNACLAAIDPIKEMEVGVDNGLMAEILRKYFGVVGCDAKTDIYKDKEMAELVGKTVNWYMTHGLAEHLAANLGKFLVVGKGKRTHENNHDAKEVTIEAWNTRSPKQEIQELSVTAVSELIQNTAREEEELIIPVELVLMLARAICRTFGRPVQQSRESADSQRLKALDEEALIKILWNNGASSASQDLAYTSKADKQAQIIEYHMEKCKTIAKAIISHFARPMVSVEEIYECLTLTTGVRDTTNGDRRNFATSIHHLLEGRKDREHG